MVNIAIISTWHVHTEGYTHEFANNANSTVKAVWDENPKNGKELADKFGVEFEPDLDKLLARTDIDAVCINAPTNTHPEIMIKAANAKKHIFTEKVFTLTVEDALKVKEAVVKNNVKFAISFPHRTHRHNLLAKKLLEEKAFGEITLMRVRNAHNGATGNWLPAHFYDQEQCGGGAMIDLGAHPLYLTRWLMGKPEAVSSTFTHHTGKAVEDNAVSVFSFKNGAIAIAETGFVTSSSPFTLELHGTEGSFICVGDDIQVRSSKLTGDLHGYIVPSNLPQEGVSAIDQFVEAVENNGTIIFDIDEAIALTEMAEAAYASHKSGSRQPIK